MKSLSYYITILLIYRYIYIDIDYMRGSEKMACRTWLLCLPCSFIIWPVSAASDLPSSGRAAAEVQATEPAPSSPSKCRLGCPEFFGCFLSDVFLHYMYTWFLENDMIDFSKPKKHSKCFFLKQRFCCCSFQRLALGDEPAVHLKRSRLADLTSFLQDMQATRRLIVVFLLLQLCIQLH